MSDKKVATVTSNKLAMSRALGAAFLNHQVEQLEKSVSNGPASGNWRDRKQAQGNAQVSATNQPVRGIINYGAKRAPYPAGNRKKGEVQVVSREDRAKESSDPRPRRSYEKEEKEGKDADIIVVDASVLVNALYQVKKWCRDGREEVVIVPLEALNTLDLLKKGTSPLAQRARAASRILEAQVGTNPRIRVQRDDAFVPWDQMDFPNPPVSGDTISAQTPSLGVSPEWVRRTICSARWEIDNAESPKSGTDETSEKHDDNNISSVPKPRVVLAIISSASLSPQAQSVKLAPDGANDAPLTPVPLPAPHIAANKYEPRTSGVLVAQWAARAGIETLEVNPTAPGIGHPSGGRGSEDEERGKRLPPHLHPHGHRGKKTSNSGPTSSGGSTASGLVERPPAVMAMMEMIAQPSKVVRLLARGEKLDPDP